MSKALLQTVNQTVQTIPEITLGNTPTTLNLGTAVHGYGCGIKLSGNAIRLSDNGYYDITANVTVAPSATGTFTLALYNGNEPIDGAIAYASVSTANNPVTVTLLGTIRKGCNCQGADTITVKIISSVGGDAQNVSVRVEKT